MDSGLNGYLIALADGALLDNRTHPNRDRYGHQRQLVVEIDYYAWVVPFMTDWQRDVPEDACSPAGKRHGSISEEMENEKDSALSMPKSAI